MNCAYADWKPTHLHIKTGGFYKMLYYACIEKTLERVIIYQGVDGNVWVRPVEEFFDGRFESLEIHEGDY
jgi:hypothetical protein